MSLKIILTKTQAISLLISIEKNDEPDRFLPVDPNHKFYKLSCEDLEEKIFKVISQEQVAGVVDDEHTIILEHEKSRSFNR